MQCSIVKMPKHALPSTTIASCLVLCVFLTSWLKLNVIFKYEKMTAVFREHVKDSPSPITWVILNSIQATWSIQWKLCPLSLVDIFIAINPAVPFRYITFVYVLFFSTLRMAVQHLQGWTGEYLCLICWNQKQVSSSFCTDDSILISTEICCKISTLFTYSSAF